jgi:hypothetical protein
MASIPGGQFHFPTGQQQVGGPQAPRDAGRLSLGAIAAAHATISGGIDTLAGGHDSVGGVAGGYGHDTLSGPQQGVGFAGEPHGGTEQVVAAQTQHGGNTVLHLPDGSTITIVGTTHVDASFLH